MKSRKTTFVIITLGILVLIALLVAQHTLRQDSGFVLPERATGTETSDENSGADTLNILSVTPKTVQAVIKTLSRPVTYERTQTVELFWSGGSSESVSQVAVSGQVTRIDTTLADKSVCHTLLTGNTAAVWYDEETKWAVINTQELSPDWLQRMPTYENVLELPISSISQADYCEKDGVYCIYVKTRPDRNGYADTYWVSAATGLLLAAERTCHSELIYRFSSVDPDGEAPAETLFLLPDGSNLP